MKTTIVIGFILVILSIQPLFLIGREFYYEMSVGETGEHLSVNFLELGLVEVLGNGIPIEIDEVKVKNYLHTSMELIELKSIAEYDHLVEEERDKPLRYIREYSWKDNTIQIEDQFHGGALTENSRVHAPITIKVNGQDISNEGLVEVRPDFVDENRYHGYFGVNLVKNHGSSELILIQRTSGIDFSTEEDLAWHLWTITEDGQIIEDSFVYHERGDVPKRVNYIKQSSASPISLGYKSNILQVWPSLFFPLLYPFVSSLLGILLIGGGALLFMKRRMGNF